MGFASCQVQHFVAVAELVGLDSHLLCHEEKKVAHVCIGVGGAAAESVVLARIVQIVAVEMALVEVQVSTMLQTQSCTSGEDDGQVGISVAVTLGHSASEHGHGGVE